MDKIKQTYETEVARLEKATLSYDWTNESFYASYLAQTYRYIVHSTKLLALAAGIAKSKDLRECLEHHVAEENGHEHWVLGDLKRLGYKLEDFPENPQTKRLYDQIYAGVREYGPAAIVGYAMALEGLSAKVCPKLTPVLTKRYGAKCSTFIKNHGEIDPGHAAESFNILKFFSESEKIKIESYIKLSAEAYIEFLTETAKALKTDRKAS